MTRIWKVHPTESKVVFEINGEAVGVVANIPTDCLFYDAQAKGESIDTNDVFEGMRWVEDHFPPE